MEHALVAETIWIYNLTAPVPYQTLAQPMPSLEDKSFQVLPPINKLQLALKFTTNKGPMGSKVKLPDNFKQEGNIRLVDNIRLEQVANLDKHQVNTNQGKDSLVDKVEYQGK